MQTIPTLIPQRNSNMEFLRVYAMLTIVFLHMCNKTMAIYELNESQPMYYIMWFLFIFCSWTTNILTFISGYFYSETHFKLHKLLSLWVQVLFYSIVFAIIAKYILNIELTSRWRNIFQPVLRREYWYITIYIAFYCLIPFIKRYINMLSQHEYKAFLVILFIGLSLIPTLFNASGWLAEGGNGGIVWFFFLYLLGAYIRKYNISPPSRPLLFYLFLSLIMALGQFFQNYLDNHQIIIEHFPKNLSAPCSVFAVGTTILIFYLFKKIDISIPLVNKSINFLGKGCLGIYLIHNNKNISHWIWETLQINHFMVEKQNLFMIIFSLFLVFLICNLIEHIRDYSFKIFGINLLINKISELLTDFYNKQHII